MLTRFRFSAMFARKLEELGVRPADVLRQGGLPTGLFDQEKILLSTEELFALYRGLAAASRDPAICLKLGTEHRLERYDPLGIAAVTARSFRDAIERMDRYKKLTCPEALKVVDQGEESRVEFRYLLAEETEPPLLIDHAFAWVVAIGRRGTDGAVNPKRIELRRPSGDPTIYEAHFGCPASLAAPRNAMVYATTDVDRPFLTHNQDLWAVLAPQLEAELSEALASKAITEQVKGMLKQLMPRGRPAIEDVARELHLSSRTLQRRLAERGTTFQLLLREARRELAHHYLRHSSIELNETAYLLGFEDAHSFFRAFNEWEGTPPGEWRARQVGSRTAAGT